MFSNIVVLTIFISISFAQNLNDGRSLDGTGWVPLSREIVMNRMDNYLLQRNLQNQNPKLLRNSESPGNIQTLRDNAIKLVQPDRYYMEPVFLQDNSGFNADKKINVTEEFVKMSNLCNKEGLSHNCNHTTIKAENAPIEPVKTRTKLPQTPFDEILRKPKAISEYILANSVATSDSDVHVGTKNENIKQDEKEVINEQETRKAYEVIEDTENYNTISTKQRNMETSAGYFYGPPQLNFVNFSRNNLTNSLLRILNGYNIRSLDNSPNYALSRINKNQNFNRNMYIPFPLRTPYRYNSLNHFPVDPVIAVSLSNYGYYLPGLYGRNSNYGNLYGYLASNNIHNNMPFGFYKIFSDTDSSN